MDSIKYKPWNEKGANISDYFNYGFDEEMFKIYQNKVKVNFFSQDQEEVLQKYESSGLNLNHKLVNFVVPHDCGGAGEGK